MSFIKAERPSPGERYSRSQPLFAGTVIKAAKNPTGLVKKGIEDRPQSLFGNKFKKLLNVLR
jgi:hypothetical protein